MSDTTDPTNAANASPLTDAGAGPPDATAGDPVVPETAVPPGETPALVCPYCERPFRTVRRGRLHVGEAHPGTCTDDERAAYEAARESESDDLFLYHLKVVFAIGSVYAAFVVVALIAFSLAG